MATRELQVTYDIDDEQHERLLELLEVVRKTESPTKKGTYPFQDFTLEKLFQLLMRLGSRHKINDSIDEYFWHFKKPL